MALPADLGALAQRVEDDDGHDRRRQAGHDGEVPARRILVLLLGWFPSVCSFPESLVENLL